MINSVGRAVAFDLDMTLVDSRRGIELSLLTLAQQFKRHIDADTFVASLGPPLSEALSPWFSQAELPAAIETFRHNMAEFGVVNVTPLPGAAEAMAAAREAGYRVVVITTKIEANAAATLRNAGLEADEIVGDVWADGQAIPLGPVGAACFVGDHPLDMAAALEAGIPGFGVTSGSSTEDELLEAGAQYVAASLAEFPYWLKKVPI